jgi:chromosome segregation ATPase
LSKNTDDTEADPFASAGRFLGVAGIRDQWREIQMDRVERQIEEHASQRAAANPWQRVVNFPVVASEDPSTSFSDDTSTALDLVSAAAEAIKFAEDRAADIAARAQTLASSATQKVRIFQVRIERIEAAKRQAEAELADAKAENERLMQDLKEADARVADQADELAAAEQRASMAEKRADELQAALQRLTHAIRTQLPVRADATKPPATA